jgi:DNA-directed RNA polymerase subunit RPC12/RpoP
MINFKCHKCDEPLEAPESMIGDTIDCPKCKRTTIIPPHPPLQTEDNLCFYVITVILGAILICMAFFNAIDGSHLIAVILFIGGCLLIIIAGIGRRLDKILDKLNESP